MKFYNLLYKYISPIFGYIMLFFYGIVDGFNGSYGFAIILFTIFARFIMLPTTISQQKGMAKQQRLAPMLIQLPFIIGLFGVLYNPLRYAIGLDASTSEALVEVFKNMVADKVITVPKSEMYYPLHIIQNFSQVTEYIAAKGISTITPAAIQEVQAFVDADRFSFFGLQLGVVPQFKEFNRYWIIPVLSGLTSLASAYITQLQQKKANPTMNAPGAGCTMLMMPAMSLYFTFLFPSGIGIYWIVSNIFALVQSVVMRKIYSPQKNIAKHMITESIERRSREASVKRINK